MLLGDMGREKVEKEKKYGKGTSGSKSWTIEGEVI